jgi:hypothetical protein
VLDRRLGGAVRRLGGAKCWRDRVFFLQWSKTAHTVNQLLLAAKNFFDAK